MRLRRRGANQPTAPNSELCRCKNGSKKELGVHLHGTCRGCGITDTMSEATK
jgi:hypothetical protein